MKVLPMFIISGLLESGKTTFIKDTFRADNNKTSKTLLFVCEQGEIEYEQSFLDEYNITVVYFEDESDFTAEKMEVETIKANPTRIIIELNGMWDITNLQFPTYYELSECINLINFDTFPVYFNNMRQKFLDNAKYADAVIFNRTIGKEEEVKAYTSVFRLTNSQAQYFCVGSDGRYQDAFDVELPYDIEQDIIKLENDDFGIWYLDTFDRPELYEEKTIDFNAMAVLSKKLPKNSFIAARMTITCCSNDIQMLGHLCMNTTGIKLKDRNWYHIVAKMKYEYSEIYKENEFVLYPTSIEKIDKPKDDILDLTK